MRRRDGRACVALVELAVLLTLLFHAANIFFDNLVPTLAQRRLAALARQGGQVEPEVAEADGLREMQRREVRRARRAAPALADRTRAAEEAPRALGRRSRRLAILAARLAVAVVRIARRGGRVRDFAVVFRLQTAHGGHLGANVEGVRHDGRADDAARPASQMLKKRRQEQRARTRPQCRSRPR